MSTLAARPATSAPASCASAPLLPLPVSSGGTRCTALASHFFFARRAKDWILDSLLGERGGRGRESPHRALVKARASAIMEDTGECVASSRGPNAIIQDFYDVGRRLTEDAMGAGGEVVRGRRLEDSQEFAIKVIRFSNSREDRSQIQAMTEVNHPGIIKLEDWFETKDMLYLVMEMARGGEMFGRIAERGKFTERDAANCFRQVLEAIGHMHARGMVHCDLKPENILYEDDTDKQIKIADFGFAQFIPGGQEGGQHLTRQLGTLSYTSPEILLKQGYTTKADMWSLGVILYILLSGIPPFGKRRGETDRDVRHHITSGRWRFYETHFANVSAEAKDMVSRLLVVDPARRLDYQQALEHQWIQGHAPEQPLGETFIVELGNFNNLRGMYKLSSHALAGLVSRFAQPDAIAAISADSQNIPRVLQEGSIQPIVSLAYSRADQERESACNALANLALRDEFQELIVREGGLRRLNQLALKRPPQSSNVRFFVALALARLAKQPDVRLPMLDSSVNADENNSTVRALVQLGQPPPTNPSRASRQAIDALALLALEDGLHHKLLVAAIPDASVQGGQRPAVLEALLWQAAEKQPADFKRGALLALRALISHATQNAQLLQVLNEQLNFIWMVANEALSKAAGEAKNDAANRLGGMVSMMLVIKDHGLLSEVVAVAGAQPWHAALETSGAQAAVPNIYTDEAPPELTRTVSQVPAAACWRPAVRCLRSCRARAALPACIISCSGLFLASLCMHAYQALLRALRASSKREGLTLSLSACACDCAVLACYEHLLYAWHAHELMSICRQIFNAMDLNPYRLHLKLAADLVREVCPQACVHACWLPRCLPLAYACRVPASVVCVRGAADHRARRKVYGDGRGAYAFLRVARESFTSREGPPPSCVLSTCALGLACGQLMKWADAIS